MNFGGDCDTRPTLVVIAGPNGAGKSTLSATLRGPAGIPVLDPDAIARHLRPDAPEQAATQAAREVLRLQRQYVARGRSFAVETTLAGTAILRLMEDARCQGFTVHVLYITMHTSVVRCPRARSTPCYLNTR